MGLARLHPWFDGTHQDLAQLWQKPHSGCVWQEHQTVATAQVTHPECSVSEGTWGRGTGSANCGLQVGAFLWDLICGETAATQRVLVKYLNFICKRSRKDAIRFYRKICFWGESSFCIWRDHSLPSKSLHRAASSERLNCPLTCICR